MSEVPVMAETLLPQVAGLQAWYGESHILHGVDFESAGASS
jgi:ABC-type branched-subunit amino acid transport system ATPase component